MRDREARLAYYRDYYRNYERAARGQKPLRDAGPVLQRLHACRDAGMTITAIAAAVGVSTSTVHRVLNEPGVRVRESVAQKLLSVHPSRPVTVVGLIRRVQALAALGWTTTQIAEAADVHPDTVQAFRRGDRTEIHGNAHRLVDAYARLSMRTPPRTNKWEKAIVTRARREAQRNGWPPPLAWDDDLIDDPAAQPDGAGYRPGTAIERVAELQEMGLTNEAIAARLGVRVDTVYATAQRGKKGKAA